MQDVHRDKDAQILVQSVLTNFDYEGFLDFAESNGSLSTDKPSKRSLSNARHVGTLTVDGLQDPFIGLV